MMRDYQCHLATGGTVTVPATSPHHARDVAARIAGPVHHVTDTGKPARDPMPYAHAWALARAGNDRVGFWARLAGSIGKVRNMQ